MSNEYPKLNWYQLKLACKMLGKKVSTRQEARDLIKDKPVKWRA